MRLDLDFFFPFFLISGNFNFSGFHFLILTGSSVSSVSSYIYLKLYFAFWEHQVDEYCHELYHWEKLSIWAVYSLFVTHVRFIMNKIRECIQIVWHSIIWSALLLAEYSQKQIEVNIERETKLWFQQIGFVGLYFYWIFHHTESTNVSCFDKYENWILKNISHTA